MLRLYVGNSVVMGSSWHGSWLIFREKMEMQDAELGVSLAHIISGVDEKK